MTTQTTETAPSSAPDAQPTSAPPPTSETPPAEAAHPNAPPEPPKVEAPKVEATQPNRPQREPLPFEPSNFDQMWRWAQWGATTRFVASEVRGSAPDVMFLLMMGRRWGLDIISSLQIFVIDGKPSLPSAHMVGIIQASPLCEYFDPIESTMERAAWATLRKGKGGRQNREIVLDYTIEEADLMGLLSKGRSEAAAARNQWNRQPKTMLRWRAATSLGRLTYADLLAGMYSTEEMIDVVEARGGTVETVSVPRSDIEAAIHRDLRAVPGLPEPAPPTPMDEAFKRATDGAPIRQPEPQRQPEPVRSTSSRVSQRAKDAKTQRRQDDGPPNGPPSDLFDGQSFPTEGKLPSCESCGVPINSGKRCPACANE